MQMTTRLLTAILVACLVGLCSAAEHEPPDATGPFEPTWESLGKHEAAPEWFRDAKFGIYFHWGVYTVPAFGSEWYPRNMHIKNRPEYRHHLDTYGDPTQFGYHDFVPQFKAEHFDADAWADLFQKAGARYAGPVAEHHDGFSMWDSEQTPWNAADKGPKHDIAGELAKAIRKRGMRFVTSFHHARNSLWQNPNKGNQWTGHYEFVKKDFPSLLENPENAILYGYMPREQFLDMWLGKLKEVIDQYQPDLIWFDSWLDEIPESYRARFAAYYLNRAGEWGKDVVITRKQDDLPLTFSVDDFEKGRANRLTENVWLTDDTISMGSWCYTSNLRIKSTSRVLHDFIDIVSKNGCLLLNVSPKSDGTIPDGQRQVLLDMGQWLQVNGEAIYDTRPWLTFGEGPSRLRKGGGFVGRLTYTPQDIRYTRSKDGKTVYAIVLGWPETPSVTLKSLEVQNHAQARVSLLGTNGSLKYRINDEKQLVIELAVLAESQRPCQHAFALKLTGFQLGLNAAAAAAAAAPPPARPTKEPVLSKDLTLDAAEAGLSGPQIRLETKLASTQNIGFWNTADGQARWQVTIKSSGSYQVTAVVAARLPSRLTVDASGRQVTADVPATGDWTKQQTITLGTITLDKADVCNLVARPADREHWKPINLWKIELTPIR